MADERGWYGPYAPKTSGPWDLQQAAGFLEEIRIPVRLACNRASGFPLLASLWFVPLEGRLWCATLETAAVAARLREDPRCAFEVSVESPPYFGVRGTAEATLHPERGEEILRVLLDRYLGGTSSRLARMLLSRVEQETAIAIAPASLVSWDYRERMKDVA
jgi:hypothetical protein